MADRNKQLQEAEKLVAKGRLDKAVKLYHRVLEQSPDDARILLKLANLQVRRGEKELAVEAFLRVADCAIEGGFFTKAIAAYQQILQVDPLKAEVHLRLADLYKHLGLLSDAIRQYEVMAKQLESEGLSREALAALGQIVELDPENVGSRVQLAEHYWREGMTQEAVGEFAQAADFLRAQGNADEFLRVADQLLQLQQDNGPLAKELAQLHLHRDDPRKALDRLQIAFKADPGDEETLMLLAECFERTGSTRKLLSALRELARIYKSAWNNEAHQEILRRIERAEETQAAQPVGAPPPEVQVMPSHVGRPALDSEDLEEADIVDDEVEGALADLEPIAELDEADLEELSADDIEEVGDGEDLATEAAASGPLGPVELHRLFTESDVYVKYGLHEKAVFQLKRALEREPENQQIRSKLKETYVRSSRLGEAARELVEMAKQVRRDDVRFAAACLNEALEIDSNNQAARQLLEQLEKAAAASTSLQPDPEVQPEVDESTGLEQVALPGSLVPPDIVPEDIPEGEKSGSLQIDLDAMAPVNAQGVPSDFLGFADDERPTALDLPSSAEADKVTAVALPSVVELDPPDRPEKITAVAAPTVADLADPHSNEAAAAPVPPAESLTNFDPPSGEEVFEDIEVPEEESFAAPMPSATANPAKITEEVGAVLLEDELAEASFFIQQKLYGEAHELVDALVKRYPGNAEVLEKSRLLGREEEMAKQAEVAEPADEDLGFGELAIDLDTEFPTEPDPPEPTTTVAEIAEEVRDNLDNVDLADAEAHYELGLAYWQMELFEDGIRAFESAQQSPDRRVACQMMIALCRVAKGDLTEAVDDLKKGLALKGLSGRERLGFQYELGQAYERAGDRAAALEHYEAVRAKDADFRSVLDRIAAVSRSSGQDAALPELDSDRDVALDEIFGGAKPKGRDSDLGLKRAE